MDRWIRLLAGTLTVWFLFLISGFATSQRAAMPEMKALLIGNSLTYWNDLPKIVQAMARAGKQPELHVESVAFPDHSLEDHWNRGDALKAIKKEKWDIVVLQQGPSASPAARASLIRYASLFAGAIRAAGAKPAIYSVWPSRARKNDLEESIHSYELAAEQAQAMLVPAGKAWKIAWQLDPHVELYDSDGLHPSRNGSFLAALVFYERFFRKSSAGLPSRLILSSSNVRTIEIDSSVARVLQQAASMASSHNRL